MKFSSAAVMALVSATGVAAFLPASSVGNSNKAATAFYRSPLSASASSARSICLAMSSTTDEAEVVPADSTDKKETFEFTSDVGRVMDLIINSLYSDKDIFLRELISNAADACDKKRFLSITDDDTAKLAVPEIKITANVEENTLTIQDSGVGMTRDELIKNLGKIAQSGTRNFVQALGEGASSDVNLIGQFGVGFYSSYLVANKVEVVTKSMQEGSQQLRWTSSADSSYTIEEDNTEFEGSGTRLILHLKDEVSEYLESSKLEELLNRYSEFIEFPISIWKETTEYKKVLDEEANVDLPEGEEPKMKTVPETKQGFERVNNQKPIWLRPPRDGDVTDEEYTEFYKTTFKASYDDPMKWSHFVLEGQVECKALLYIPGMLPFELSKDMFDEDSRNIRLYVKRVFINDKFEDIMPRWLKFIRGVVDSDDLPLNVSREILQKSKVLSIINKRLVRKSLDMIRDIAEDEDESKYITFWNNFGKYLKVGVVEEDKNRKDLAPLLRFFSSKSGEEYTSLDKYVKGMPEAQKAIYFVTGDGRENAAMSPVIEKLASRGYDVLFATEPLDEIMMENLRSYKEKDIVDAAKENLKLDDNEDEETKKKKENLQGEFKPLATYLETLLGSKVQKVVISDLLTDSPSALVQGAYGMSPTMQKYMRAQSVASGGGDMKGMNKAVLEVNPNHPIVKDLYRMIKADRESKELEERALLMYDVAAMTSGYEVADMKDFAKRVMSLMNGSMESSVTDADVVSKTEAAEETKADVVSQAKAADDATAVQSEIVSEESE